MRSAAVTEEAQMGEIEHRRVAIVTGAAHGIGLAIAQRLSRDCSVVLADIDLEEARSASADLGPTSRAVKVDVTSPESVDRMVSTVLEGGQGIDILVNNAGIVGLVSPVHDYPIAEWYRIFAVNVHGVFLCTRAVLPHMLARKSGHIVNVASISGKEGNPNMSAYSASKAAVIGLTKAIGKETAQSGVLVNCVTPAVIATGLLSHLSDEAVSYMVSRIPMGRIGQPAEVAELVAWLASPSCSFATGAVFDISGGRATY
jgi:2-dehydro-3-deoxy-L-rhamnonate dehydrogenase (NAD+)